MGNLSLLKFKRTLASVIASPKLIYFHGRPSHFEIQKLAYFHGRSTLLKFQKELQQTFILP
jgi:hypothetical protein